MRPPRRWCSALALCALLGCDDGAGGVTADAARDGAAPPPADAGDGRDGAAPPPADAAPPADGGAIPADGGGPSPDAGAPGDARPPPPDLELEPIIAAAPADPLAGGGPRSCPIYLDTRCTDGRAQRCEIYDPAASAFVDDPDPLLRRVLLYDRWYDRYMSPDGQTAERVFTGPTPGDMPEAEWAAPEHFARYAGAGDGAIWTGVALTADVFRYAETGTEADYQRVEAKVRTLLTLFDVTGVPGYLARYHYLVLPDGGPRGDAHILRYAAESFDSRDLPIEAPERVPDLPEDYRLGVPGPGGRRVAGTPMWHGHPSIDQYTGPWIGLPLAWPLLRDGVPKARIVTHLTCYLKRLRRLELINLQQNPDLRLALTRFIGEGGLRLDPGDPDLLALDRVVAWYLPGINPENAADFDRTCPEHMALEPTRVVDAAAPDWLAQVLRLVQDLGGDPGAPRPGQIDHMYVPNVRGGDASHLMQMAAVAWWMTGDPQYRDFLFDELIGALGADRVVLAMQAFRNPDFCFKFYGDHITYGAHWLLTSMLPVGPLRQLMRRAMHEELWEKALFNHANAKFDLMYAATAPDAEAETRSRAAAEAVAQLRVFGGNGGVQDAPRRTFNLDAAEVIARLPAGTTVRCPTETEREACETGVELFGVTLEARPITRECDGRPGECVMADGLCADGIASAGLPANLRRYADFMWQRSPFALGERRAIEGQEQSPGRDLSEPYWMARFYGHVTEGAGEVLAWRDAGACP